MLEHGIKFLTEYGLNIQISTYAVRVAAFFGVILLSYIAYELAARIGVRLIRKMISHTRTKWDDYLQELNFFRKLANFAPALVVFYLAPTAFGWNEILLKLVFCLTKIYMVLIAIISINALVSALYRIYQSFEISKEMHFKGFVQIIQIAVIFIGTIMIAGVILDKNPLYLISGLGAMTAVLMLVFKDALLGFAAGLQLIGNRMVAQGDWIEMPAFGADGNVMEVGLTTVKVRNFDKTITTIPTYAMISSSFKNWRGMQQSGGRRIKRSVYIDMSSIKFCDDTMIYGFREIRYISNYIQEKTKEINEYNSAFSSEREPLANRRQLTNIGTFRAYLKAYLRQHPMIDPAMTFIVRQLSPTPQGLPIEIYVFCKSTDWVEYEGVQSDIFDHILAIAPVFDLNIFQTPSGNDFQFIKS